MVWNYVIIWAITSLISYALSPRPQNQKPEGFEDVEIPSVEEGKDIPVIFGRMEISPFVGWYGDFSTKAIKAEGKKGGKK